MEEARVYRVPDYYKDFECKCGECRRSCCRGWPIAMSMKEYFRLLSLDCSPALRRKLDAGLHLADRPEPERYALLLPDWRGECPLQADDGLCMLHAECGPDAICEICRLYPRSPRAFSGHECACSNSCERTLELLFARTEPLGFVEAELVLPEPEPVTGVPEVVSRHYSAIRGRCIAMLQDRARPLEQRLVRLGRFLSRLDPAVRAGDGDAIDRVLDEPEGAAAAVSDPALTLSFLTHFNHSVGLNSVSVCDYARAAEELMTGGEGEPSAERFEAVKSRFRQSFPDWQILFEQMLVNHVFYESFPFSDRHENLFEEFLSLVAVYAYSAFLAAAWTFSHPGREALTDVLAAAFRLIDHSPFDYNAAVIMERLGIGEAAADGIITAAL